MKRVSFRGGEDRGNKKTLGPGKNTRREQDKRGGKDLERFDALGSDAFWGKGVRIGTSKRSGKASHKGGKGEAQEKANVGAPLRIKKGEREEWPIGKKVQQHSFEEKR